MPASKDQSSAMLGALDKAPNSAHGNTVSNNDFFITALSIF
jgi:hypothetical protein